MLSLDIGQFQLITDVCVFVCCSMRSNRNDDDSVCGSVSLCVGIELASGSDHGTLGSRRLEAVWPVWKVRPWPDFYCL